jgi:hypothetical protein
MAKPPDGFAGSVAGRVKPDRTHARNVRTGQLTRVISQGTHADAHAHGHQTIRMRHIPYISCTRQLPKGNTSTYVKVIILYGQ